MVTIQELYTELGKLLEQVDPSSPVQILTLRGDIKPIAHVAWSPVYGLYVKEEKRK